MEFADSSCSHCGAEFGKAEPEKIIELDSPYETPYGRVVEFVGPCPSCGENIPLWVGREAVAGPESAPEPESESEPEPET